MVLTKGNRTKKNAGQPLSTSTIQAWIKAIVDLWTVQVSNKINNNPHPRGTSVKAKLDAVKRSAHQRKKETFQDRGKGSIQDGYSPEELEKLAIWWLQQQNPACLRTRCSFLLSHMTLARGETMRELQLADIFCMEMPNEGSQKCTALVFTQSQGKTNQFNRNEYGAAIRSTNPAVCSVGGLGLHLFWRYHVNNEKFPDFTSRETWYHEYLFKGKSQKDPNKNVAITYEAELAAVNKAFAANHVVSVRKTHAPRGSASHELSNRGGSDAEIARMGHWAAGAMAGAYLTGLEKKGMRILAGFPPRQGSYFIARGG